MMSLGSQMYAVKSGASELAPVVSLELSALAHGWSG